MPLKPSSDQPFARLLWHLMQHAPEGPVTISQLARRTGMPRSTVHRHLKGKGNPSRKTLEAYAKALAAPLDELLALAGYRVTQWEGFDPQVTELAVELSLLDPQTLATVREIAAILKRRQQRPPSASEGAVAGE